MGQKIRDITFGDAIIGLLLIVYMLGALITVALIMGAFVYYSNYGQNWPYIEQYDFGKTAICSGVIFILTILFAKGLDAFLYRERKEEE